MVDNEVNKFLTSTLLRYLKLSITSQRSNFPSCLQMPSLLFAPSTTISPQCYSCSWRIRTEPRNASEFFPKRYTKATWRPRSYIRSFWQWTQAWLYLCYWQTYNVLKLSGPLRLPTRVVFMSIVPGLKLKEEKRRKGRGKNRKTRENERDGR